LQVAIDRINSASVTPDLLIHTGDLSHLSKGDEFDALDQVLKGLKTKDHFFVPGEHDVLEDGGALYKERYGKQGKGDGWYSFEHRGVHFVGLVNVMNLKPGGLGALGNEQLAWLESDVKGLHSSTPIVVFAHVPLWTVYPDWGWGTDDGAQALSYLKRFGSVTVLNGHIHQTMQKVEGNMFFHTAGSTAFPQPKPGQAKGPGPMVVPADQLRGLLGLTSVQYLEHQSHLAVVDSTLADKAMASDAKELTVKIDNFSFSPSPLSVGLGTRVSWVNHDDIPHNVVETRGAFKSKTLDTDDHYEHVFNDKGTFEYYCSIHPHMTGKIIVQ
jgi:plastocyanin